MNRKEEFLNDCIILDTETTSKDYAAAEVIEYGYILRMNGEWQEFNTLHKPYEPITAEISAITNITNKMVAGEPYFEDMVDKVKETIEAYCGAATLVAHNSFYDMKVLENYGIDYPQWLCTMRIAKKLHHEDNTVTAFNLPYLRYRFEILEPADHPNIDAHRASADALVTAHLLEQSVDEMIELGVLTEDAPYAPQIQAWLDEPIVFDTMPMGKHKGKKLVDVPMDYWKWALSNMDSLDETKENFDKDFAASVEKALAEKMGM